MYKKVISKYFIEINFIVHNEYVEQAEFLIAIDRWTHIVYWLWRTENYIIHRWRYREKTRLKIHEFFSTLPVNFITYLISEILSCKLLKNHEQLILIKIDTI